MEIRLVLDNYGTHKTALVWPWLQKRSRYFCTSLPGMLPAQLGGALVRTPYRKGRSSAARTGVLRNGKKRFESASMRIASSRDLFDGPNPQMKSWPSSPVPLLPLVPLTLPRLMLEINALRRHMSCFRAIVSTGFSLQPLRTLAVPTRCAPSDNPSFSGRRTGVVDRLIGSP
jgi:hypothetical protein